MKYEPSVVLSAIGTLICKVAKFLLHFFGTFLAANEYTVIDLFYFADETRRQEPNS